MWFRSSREENQKQYFRSIQTIVNKIGVEQDSGGFKLCMYNSKEERILRMWVNSKEEGLELLREIQFEKLIDEEFLELTLECIRRKII